MTEGLEMQFEEAWRARARTWCEKHGHTWRFETRSGISVRICTECGATQTLIDQASLDEWGGEARP